MKNHPKHLAVLNAAAEKGDWGKPMPKGKGRGIAIVDSFGVVIAHVAEVTRAGGERCRPFAVAMSLRAMTDEAPLLAKQPRALPLGL